jgi:hypothetical protein
LFRLFWAKITVETFDYLSIKPRAMFHGNVYGSKVYGTITLLRTSKLLSLALPVIALE